MRNTQRKSLSTRATPSPCARDAHLQLSPQQAANNPPLPQRARSVGRQGRTTIPAGRMRTPQVASTTSSRNPRAFGRWPPWHRGPAQKTDDLHRQWRSFIRFIHGGRPNVGLGLRLKRITVDSPVPDSGMYHKQTTSDTMFLDRLWAPLVRCPVDVLGRSRHQFRHGTPGCGPLLRNPFTILTATSMW